MIAVLLTLGAMACCVFLGWHGRARIAARREAWLVEELRQARLRFEKTIPIELRLQVDNQRLADWCGRFRDMYLDAIHLIDPKLSAELRRKWAQLQAPEAVNRLLRRVKHG